VLGLDVATSPLEIRARVGYMPENDAHIPGMNAVSFVAYCGQLSGLPPVDAMQRAHEVLYYVGLGEARYRNVETYSKGMKQRIKLAQALVHDPYLLFLDEPTNGMDPKGRDEMLALIHDLGHAKRVNLILSSHLLPDVEHACDHVIVMDCADWQWDGDDDRRLLYVAMTRARQTLVTLRAETGRNAYLTDLGSVDGVAEALPAVRPVYRSELDRRYVTLGPADVFLDYAGHRPAGAGIHADLAAVRVGDEIKVAGRRLLAGSGRVLGQLAKACRLPDRPLSAEVYAVMVRTRAQTSPDYLAAVAVEQWEVPLAEVTLPSSELPARQASSGTADSQPKTHLSLS